MKLFKKLLILFELLIGFSSLAGGVALIIVRDFMGIPVSVLTRSVFTSFFWPGVILAVIVGGIHFAAGLMLASESKYKVESLAVAGFGLLIWIFTEVCIIGYGHWLQALYFIFAILTLISAMLILRYDHPAEKLIE